MKKSFLLMLAPAAFTLLASHAHAVVTTQVHWRMGEDLSSGFGTDSSGNAFDLGNTNGGGTRLPSTFTTGIGSEVLGSTVATNVRADSGRAGFFGGDLGTLMTADNWGMELWVRSANTSQSIDFVTDGDVVAGNLKFSQLGGVWAASYDSVAWIGASNGTGQTATAEQWTHLAVVNEAGTSTFYIDGVAQAGTSTDSVVWNDGIHLGVLSGGATGWNGDFDEVRLFTFNAGEFDASSDFLIVPEPSTYALLAGALALGVVMLRRRLG